jgi:hypothetical protein
VQPLRRDIQVRARLLQAGVPEHVLHVVDRPARFEQPGTGFVTIMPRAA